MLATVAEHYPDLVREIHDAGHEIATHGYAHRLVYRMRPEEFEEDLVKSLKLIENVIGEKVVGHRAGYFSITKQSLWALDILAKHGIKYDSSIFPIRRRLYGIPDFPRFVSQVRSKGRYGLREVPPSTVRIWGQNVPIAGGGYLRVLPYWVIKQGIRRVNAQGHPAVIYLHPYELDPQDIKVPGVSLGWGTRFTQLSQRFNRSTFEGKLRKLLRDFKFGSVREVLDL